MLGVFDSGFGGLTVLREIRQALPQYSIAYLGDNARAPYGSRPLQQIHQYTLEGVVELFSRGAELIVLACNTSSSVALRRIQQEFLPLHQPSKRVLGIVIPTAEEVARLSRTRAVGVLATEATVASNAYPQEIHKVDSGVQVRQRACPLLVPLIEAGQLVRAEEAARKYVGALLAEDRSIDTLLLGCTHYALIEDIVRRQVPPEIRVISQGAIVARKLTDYLQRHPEIAARVDTSGKQSFLTTDGSPRVQQLAAQFFGKPITLETVTFAGM